MEILAAILVLGILGAVFGAGLAFANKKFCVHVDPRIEEIYALMPGSNCGACGKAGCMGLVEAMLKGEATPGACVVCSPDNREQISKILGLESEAKVKKAAVLHCQGGNKVKDRFKYSGLPNCQAAMLVMGGQKACIYGCLGFGDCVKVCPFDAIGMTDDGLPEVDINKCTACGKCVKACPKHLFSLEKIEKKVHIACKSYDLGKDVMKVCSVGCIACGKCVTTCPFNAIRIENNLAIIDYEKCTVCEKCVAVCPTKAIVKLE